MAGYHHGDLRRALIDAALALLTESGAEQLSLRAVARKAEVSHAAPYRHFPDKNALLAAVAERGFSQLTAALESAEPRLDSPREWLRAESLQYLNFALAHSRLYRLMFGPQLEKPAHEALASTSLAAFGQLVDRMAEIGRQEEGTDADAGERAMVLWATLHGLALLMLDGQLGALGVAGVSGLVDRAVL